jgi:PAS domain S-box-containing protein
MDEQHQVVERETEGTFDSDAWLFSYHVDLRGEPELSYVSPTIEETLGFQPGDLEESSEFLFIKPEDRQRFGELVAAPPAAPFKEVFRLVDVEGREHAGRHTYRPIVDGAEEVVGLECVVYERPADWELPFDSIIDAINEGIAIVQFDGELIYVNQRMADMVGYHPEEIVGKTLFDFMSEKWAMRAKKTLARRKEGITEVFDHKLQYRDGSEFWTMVSANPMEEEKGFSGSLVAIRDISRRKQMEEELERSRDELEERVEERTAQLRKVNEALQTEVQERREAEEQALEASRAKSAFLANMSHELRTPLNAVIGYTELIQEDVELADKEGTQLSLDRIGQDLGKIGQAANHLLDLINDILDLSKVEAGKMDFHSESFELGELLEEVVQTVQPVIDTNDNEVRLQKGTIDEIRTDRTKLKQILINLVGNAAKFTDAGTIDIEVEPTSISGEDAVKISVTDTGMGIPEDELEELFEPFTQADTSSTREHGGTGLGLTICRRFSEMLQGYLTAESEVGVGSTFTVAVPVGAESKEGPEAEGLHESSEIVFQEIEGLTDAVEESDGSDTTVLVIDDDPSVHDMMGRFLRSRGFSILSALDGEEGLALARSEDPDVITLDVMMPGQDGWSVLARLNSQEETSEIPVVMVTMIDDKSAGYALGAADYLVKPIQGQRLVDTLSKYRSESADGETALVVEDDRDTREVVTRHLTRVGWEVAQAADGDEALEQLEKIEPSVVVLDLMMPHTDGFEVADKMRRHPEWEAIPVVVLTAMDLTDKEIARLDKSVEMIYEKGARSIQEIVQEVVEVAADGER